jgi:TDG/mug DNA glycosylase family protein
VSSAVPDVLAPGLKVVFCGINPGMRSAAAGAHFANPRNDFWRLLAEAAMTPRLLAPEEQWTMLELGYGLTNAAYRTARGSGELRRGDFAGAAERLERIAAELGPAVIGLQQPRLGATKLFVLPSTSPANAAVSYAERLRWFRKLAALVEGL